MLEGLDQVPWERLAAAYGPATRVPKYLRRLTSRSRRVRDKAMDDLLNEIYHQTSVYEATPYAIPFLVELLAHESVEDKHFILSALWSLACANQDAREADEILRRMHEAARPGIPVYLRFLQGGDHLTRAFAALLLSVFDQDMAQIAPALEAAARAETDVALNVEYVLALGEALADSATVVPEQARRARALFAELVRREERGLRLAAAIALARAARGDTPPEVVALLVEALVARERHPRLGGGQVGGADVLRALSGLGRAQGVPALAEALVGTTDRFEAHRLMEALLDLAFHGKQARGYHPSVSRGADGVAEIRYRPPFRLVKREDGIVDSIPEPGEPVRSVTALTDDQRLALAAIVRSEGAWAARSNLLELYGLPSSRDDLRALLSAAQRHTRTGPTAPVEPGALGR